MTQPVGVRRFKTPRAKILFEDDRIVAVDKPAGVWPREGVFDEPSVYDLIAPDQAESEIAPVQVTDLDHMVSGVALYARDAATAETMRTQFRDRAAMLVYDAIVRGPLLRDAGVIEPAAASDDVGKQRASDEPGGRIEWRVTDTFIGFARLELQTSATHDDAVRRAMENAAMPLAVDSRFGGASNLLLSSFKAGYRKSRRRPERPLIERPSLHARLLRLNHPADGRAMSYETPPPKDLRALLHQLDRFGRLPK